MNQQHEERELEIARYEKLTKENEQKIENLKSEKYILKEFNRELNEFKERVSGGQQIEVMYDHYKKKFSVNQQAEFFYKELLIKMAKIRQLTKHNSELKEALQNKKAPPQESFPLKGQ